MNKKTVGVVAAAILAIVLAIVGVFFLKGRSHTDVLTEKEIAENLHKVDPSKTEKEWIEVGKQELTEEQQKVAEEVFSEPIPEIKEVISVDAEKNEVTFKDVNGDEWVMEADPDIANMTDEEANAYTQQILDSLGTDTDDGGRVDFGQGAVNFPSDNQGNNGTGNQGKPQVDTNYEDVKITDDLDWNNSEVGEGPGSAGTYDPDADVWTDPYAGMTPEEKAAAIKDAQERQQIIDNETTGTMHD